MTVPGSLYTPTIRKTRASAYLLEQSALFDGAAYLTRTPSVAGNRKTWTFSCWVKRSEVRVEILFSSGNANTDDANCYFANGNVQVLCRGSGTSSLISNAEFRDFSAWYHLVFAFDTTQATSSNRIKIWVNGTRLTSFSTETYPAQNSDTYTNDLVAHYLGRNSVGNYSNALMALPILVDGAALDPTSFGELDDDGYWNPIAYVTGAEPAAIGATWRGSYSSDTDAASYTNSGAAIGTADADRYVIVAIPLFTGPTNLTISSVTIGGVSATKINGETFYSGTSTNRSLVDFWKANVPTGTTGDIVITPSTTAPRMSASWWTCIGDVAIIDTQADIATDVTPDNSLTVTSKRPSNGFVLAAITGQGDSGDPTFTWGGTGITENYETGWGDTDATHGSASGDFTSASTEAITVTNGTGDMYYYILSAVTFAPPGGDGAYGTNGGAYDFAINTAYGTDVSGNGNDFTDSGFATTDQLADTPTDSAADGIGNFATLNPLAKGSNVTLSEGNLRALSSSGFSTVGSTVCIPAGSTDGWYWESYAPADASNQGYFAGIVSTGGKHIGQNTYLFTASFNEEQYGIYAGQSPSPSYVYSNTTETNPGVSNFVKGTDYTQWAYKDGKLWVGKNDTWELSGDPAAGTSPLISGIDTTKSYTVATSVYPGQSAVYVFAYGQFQGTIPTGFKAIATQNFPAPTIADGSDYFNAVLYTGTGSTNSVTGVGFQPDFVWWKNRTDAAQHMLGDVVRGAGKVLASNSTDNAEDNLPPSWADFTSNGFFASAGGGLNQNSQDFVAWCWKAGGAAVTNTVGSITSSVSANPTSGFSIATYTGIGSSGTVGHGLGAAPKFIIIKSRSNASTNWRVYHDGLGGITKYLLLNSSAAVGTASMWGTPGTTAFTIGGATYEVNETGQTYVAYCWAEVEGFSKFGSYTGNGSTDGPFVYCGFRPAFILYKKTSGGGQWGILDNKRDTYNPAYRRLFPDASDAENTGVNPTCDFLSNGFKMRNTNSDLNASGGTYIFAAFAEHPFQGDAGVTQARAR